MSTDPETSELAAQPVKMRAGSQKARLLACYETRWFAGLTDEEAGKMAGLPRAWKRCSDLRREGLIETRKWIIRRSSFGRVQRVCFITEAGKKMSRAIDEPKEVKMTNKGNVHGATVRALREKSGLSQQRLAERAGLAMLTISRIELGKVSASHPLTIKALAEALGVPADMITR